MAEMKQYTVRISFGLFIAASWIFLVVSAAEDDHHSKVQVSNNQSPLLENDVVERNFLGEFASLLKGPSSYTHVWPEMTFGWRIIVGTLIAFSGAAFGSAGGIGAGGIFVPMLTLTIGFDAKSSTAISKCMIMGLTSATVYYNLRQKHPTLNLPLIDYDLALLVQPMLLLGISTGVALNIIFANWMVTILLIITFLGISMRSFMKGMEMWKKETIKKKEAAQQLKSSQGIDVNVIEYKPLPGGSTEQSRGFVSENVNWKELAFLVAVWLAFLAIQISKDFTTTCSVAYWVLNLLQIPVAAGATGYQVARLCTGNRDIADFANGEVQTQWRAPQQLVLCPIVALLAGTLGGLLGLGGGFVLGPLFLEIGVIPQVSSATTTFVMAFSSSMCAIEYYLLKRFPLPYALYFVGIAIAASLTGQYVVRKWIARAGRASIIVFILSSIIFASAILLGGQGIANMIYKIQHKEYMGFEDLCTYDT